MRERISHLLSRVTGHSGERVYPNDADPLFEAHLENYRFMSQFVSGANVLDVGCGCGYGSHFLLSAGAQQVYGIDYSRKALRYARRHYKDPMLTFLHMNAEALTFPDASFDVAVSLENLEHLAQPAQCIAEARRVLRPNGLLLLATPNKDISSPLQERCPNPYHLVEFDYDSLDGLLREHFAEVAIFETLYEGSEVTKQLTADRRQRQRIGIEAYDASSIVVGHRKVDLKHRHNEASFLAMAWGEVAPTPSGAGGDHSALPEPEQPGIGAAP